ncbi:MAG: phosphomannose isomerase type II C-terminal cupin domain [Deltaproteobacteria bacterium]|nr:phosphomannose isomerase type II C-terminal cupin domain [Deltaproteobacteria bacterium]MBW2658377.1 phosphomannose isomerase type II C-terminal cupin domain [Deltaproteobacteria bacterium]
MSITTAEFTRLTDHRPWGSFTILADEQDHKVKRLVVKPGCRLSLQRHKFRDEHWFVISGSARVILNDTACSLEPGEAIEIKRGDLHRVGNDASINLVFIEIQTGDYFGEDDIERLDDDYGRND